MKSHELFRIHGKFSLGSKANIEIKNNLRDMELNVSKNVVFSVKIVAQKSH
jgi:hypothetical protein